MRQKLRRLQHRLATHRHVRRIRRVTAHPFAVPVLAFSSLVLIAFVVLALLLHSGTQLESTGNDIVIISHDHIVQTVPSHEPTVGMLLAKLKLTINPGDVVEPALDTEIHQDDFRINIYRAAPVKIIDSSGVVRASSAATTARSIASQAGLKIYPEDNLTAEPVGNFLTEGAIANVVTIDRSTPLTIDVNGFPAQTRTRTANVGSFLKEKHIQLGTTGTVSPAQPTPITAGMVIKVARDGTGITTVTETIPMPVSVSYDASLAYGTSAIRQAGSEGQKLLTYRTVVKNGQLISKTLLQEVVVSNAVTEIVVQGTNLSGIKGDMALAGISADQYQYADYIISHESGWCPTKWQGEYGTCPVYHGAPTSAGIGYGLCQATPGYKMATAGDDWATNPITQLKWCTGYANARYGSWYNAYLHWLSYHNW